MAYIELEPWEEKRKKETALPTVTTTERKYQEQKSTEDQRDFTPTAAAQTEEVVTAVTTEQSLPQVSNRKWYEQASNEYGKAYEELKQRSNRKWYEQASNEYGSAREKLKEASNRKWYEQAQNEFGYWSTYDIAGAKQEQEELRRQLRTLQENLSELYGTTVNAPEDSMAAAYEEWLMARDELERTRNRIPSLQREIDRADAFQKQLMYYGYLNAGDFEALSRQGAAVKNPTFEKVDGFGGIWGGNGKKEAAIDNIVTYSRDNWQKSQELRIRARKPQATLFTSI